MKAMGRLFLGLVALIVALVVAGTAVVMSTDARQVSNFVADRVKALTGRDLSIDGDIVMKLSLVPTVSASDVRFSNAPWGSRPDMVRLKRIEVGLELLPLLRGEIRLSELVLVEPDILLERRPDGQANWNLKSDASSSAVIQEAETELKGYADLPVLNELSLVGGRLSFIDQQSKYRRDVSIQRIDLAGDSIDERMQVDVAVGSDGEAYTLGGSISSLYRLLTDPRFFNFDLVGTAFGASMDLRGVVQAPLSRRHMDAKVSVKAVDGRGTLARLAGLLDRAELVELPLDGQLAAEFQLSGTTDNLAIENIEAAAGRKNGLMITASGNVQSALSQPAWVLNVAASVPEPSVLSKLAGRSLPAAPSVSISATLSNDGRALLIDSGALSVGETRLAGNFRVEPTRTPMLVSGAISSGVVRLADFRPFSPDGPEVKPENNDGRVLPDIRLSIGDLPAIDGSLKLAVGDVQVDDLSVSDIALSISKTGRKVDLSIAKAHIAGGRVSGDMAIDGGVSEPLFSTDLQYRGGNVDQLMAYLTDLHLLSGAVDADVKINGSGTTVRQIAGGLNGRVEVVMDQGKVADRYVELLAADVLAELMPWADKTRVANINCFVSRFEIKDGLATNTGLLFDTDKLAVTGSGTINLKDERLNMSLNPKPKEGKLVSLGVPINITGTLAAPKAAPTTAAVVKGVAGLALGLVNPLALLLVVADKGDARNNCMAALDRSQLLPTAPSSAQPAPPLPAPEKKPSSPAGKVIEGVEKGIEGVGKGIGRAIEGILGGGK